MATSTSQAIVPLDKNATDDIFDLVSMFSQMKIGRLRNCSESEDEDESTYINGEKVINYITFHKYLPGILASLAKGNTITILDNRIHTTVNSNLPECGNALAPVPYKSDPLLRLCDENTVLTYDNINHIIKLWDLRRNYSNYKRQPSPKSVIYLSMPNSTTNSSSDALNYNSKPSVDIDDIDSDLIPNISTSIDTSKKYSLNYVLTWPESLPSVVVTYSDNQTPRNNSVVIEELPDDWEESSFRRREILPIVYKQSHLKRKCSDDFEEIYTPKKSITTCSGCGKAAPSTAFCCACSVTGSKRKSTEELCHENKRFHSTNSNSRILANESSNKVEITELRGKRKLDDDLTNDIKRIHLEIEALSDVQHLPDAEPKVQKAKPNSNSLAKSDVENNLDKTKGKLNDSKIVNLSKYMLDDLLLNSALTTEKLDWKSKLRERNCDPKPTKMPKLFA